MDVSSTTGTSSPAAAAAPTAAGARSLPASPRVQAKNEVNLQGNIHLQGNHIKASKSSKSSSHLLDDSVKGSEGKKLLDYGKKIVIVPAAIRPAPVLAPPPTPVVPLPLPPPPAQNTRPVDSTGTGTLAEQTTTSGETGSSNSSSAAPAGTGTGAASTVISRPVPAAAVPDKYPTPVQAQAPAQTPGKPARTHSARGNDIPLSRTPSNEGARTPPNKDSKLSPQHQQPSLGVPNALGGKPRVDMWTPGSGHRFRSMRSLRDDPSAPTSWASMQLTDGGGDRVVDPGRALPLPLPLPLMSDVASVRSLASIGMGSTDGRKLTIRRVPTSPNELLNYSMNGPQTPVPIDFSSSNCSSTSSLSEGAPYRPPRREHWANRAQFVLACVGYCVGLGTVWRFPYLCYKSGGGVFLIPYFTTLLLCGIPMLYMEMSVGQFTRRGPIGTLSMLCPLFKGAGVSSVIIAFIMSTYYNVLIAYSVYYLFSAFRSELPWNSCNHRWNTPRCWSSANLHIHDNLTHTRPDGSRTAAEEFFENKVLHMSGGLDDPRSLRWELVACLLVAWVLVYFAVWKSVRSSGRMLYFTATLPFALVIVFLGRALTLEGADVGLRYFFKPEWHLLGDAKVWVNALAQNFNSIGIALGSVISLSSYNRYDSPILVDTLAVSAISVLSSMLVGLFAFATIGNIAHELHTGVEDVLSDGPGLVFVLYPQTMAKMPAAQFWSVCFFTMMLCLGLNTQFAMVEVVVTSIQDGFPGWIKRHLNSHEVLVLLICVVSFIFGLPCVTQGGIYFFQLVDHYTASISIMYLAFFEVVGVAWLYGAGRLAGNVREMTGRAPGLYMRACWWVVSPATLLAVWVFFLIDYEPPTYNNGQYYYPWWAESLGWGIASLSLAAIPVMAALAVCKAEGSTFMEKLISATRPRIQESKAGSLSLRGDSPINGHGHGLGRGPGAGNGSVSGAGAHPQAGGGAAHYPHTPAEAATLLQKAGHVTDTHKA